MSWVHETKSERCTQQAFLAAPLGWIFFSFSFFSAFLSFWLQKTGQVWIRGGSAGRGVSILLTRSLSLSSICIFEVLRWAISEGGQQQRLTDECFLNISCAHQKVCVCVCVCVFVLKKGADLQGVLEEWVWLNQAAITASVTRMESGSRSEGVERWRGEAAQGRKVLYFALTSTSYDLTLHK